MGLLTKGFIVFLAVAFEQSRLALFQSAAISADTISSIAGLGWVHNFGPFKTAQGIEEFQLELHVQAILNYTLKDEIIQKVIELLSQVSGMQKIKPDTALVETVSKLIIPGIVDLKTIQKQLVSTSKYSHATRQHENTYNCVIQIEDIGVHVFEALLADLTQNIKGLNLAWTAEEIKTDVQKLSAIISFGQDARLMIADLLQQVKGHENILDSVTSGIIPSTLLPLLQEAPCYAEGELEQVAISNCEKLINGVHCDITVKIFTAITEYQLYMPIR